MCHFQILYVRKLNVGEQTLIYLLRIVCLPSFQSKIKSFHFGSRRVDTFWSGFHPQKFIFILCMTGLPNWQPAGGWEAVNGECGLVCKYLEIDEENGGMIKGNQEKGWKWNSQMHRQTGELDRNTERHKQWSKRLPCKKAQLVCSWK